LNSLIRKKYLIMKKLIAIAALAVAPVLFAQEKTSANSAKQLEQKKTEQMEAQKRAEIQEKEAQKKAEATVAGERKEDAKVADRKKREQATAEKKSRSQSLKAE